MATRIDATVAGADSNCYLNLADANSYFADGLREDAWAGKAESDRERALIQATSQTERLRLRGSPSDPSTPQALHFPRAGDYDWVDDADENGIYNGDGDTLDLVSTSASDTQDATIVGHDTDGFRVTEDVTLTGASAVTSTLTYERLRSVTLDSVAIGTITISETNGGTDLASIAIGDTAPDTTWELVVLQGVKDAICEQALWLLEEAEDGGDLIDHQAMRAAGVKSVSVDGVWVAYGGGVVEGWAPKALRLLQKFVSRTAKVRPRGGGTKAGVGVGDGIYRGDPDG